ncbi:hypothetical protein [Mycobacteroides abscessus]|uniref:hypothetical protein n=1 Tax=Mycobacteroides abscessus TaxID=36809 RepID=UPI0009286461|nr:hypothetical protein [Mycobacteroides abscessus]SIC59875.1 Uncharacterised protein [Mycobacteroides abscessus subsp. abscessus]
MNKKLEQPENIGDIFTKEGLKNVTVGQVLGFQQDGKLQRYKVVKRNIKRREIWVRPVKLYRPADVQVTDKTH